VPLWELSGNISDPNSKKMPLGGSSIAIV